jgi:translation initiation factor IF-3
MNKFSIKFIEDDVEVTITLKGRENELAPFINNFFDRKIKDLVITNIETGQFINYNNLLNERRA